MFPVVWKFAVFAACVYGYAAPQPSSNVTLYSKLLAPDEESATPQIISSGRSVGKIEFSNGANPGTTEAVSSQMFEEPAIVEKKQKDDQWPPPQSVSFAVPTIPASRFPTRKANRGPRKLAKDILTRLASNESVMAIPESVIAIPENDQISAPKTEISNSEVLITTSNDDPIAINNNVLVTPRQELTESKEVIDPTTSRPVLKQLSSRHFIVDAIVKDEKPEKGFLPDEHIVQKLTPQIDHETDSYVPPKIFHPAWNISDSATAEAYRDSNHSYLTPKDLQHSEENQNSNHSYLTPKDPHHSGRIIGEDNDNADTPAVSAFHQTENSSSEEKRTPTNYSMPSLGAILHPEEYQKDEDLKVVPTLKGKLAVESYSLKYVEIESKPKTLTDMKPSTVSSDSLFVKVKEVKDSTTIIQPLTSNETISAMGKWKALERKIRIQSNSLLKKLLPKILEHSGRSNVTSQCTKAMIQLISGLRSLKSWAVKMVDSSGKFPSGGLEGTLTDFGDYDECLNIRKPSKRGDDIEGQYCTVEMRPILPPLTRSVTFDSKVLDFGNNSKDTVFSDLSDASALFHIMVLRVGLCVPSRCSDSDINQLISMAFQDVPVEVTVPWCEVKQPMKFSTTQMVIIAVMASFLFMVCIGTAADVYMRRRKPKCLDIGRMKQSMCAFSLVSNVNQLLQTSTHSSSLGAVNGVRCLSLAWIILAHTYGFGHRQGLARLTDARHYMKNITFQIITNGWLSVDTFFLIGGLLVASSTLKTMEKTGGKINFIPYALHRIWRLTPPVVAVVGIMFLLPLIGSGPLWPDMVGKKVANCEQRWWQAILPINSWLDFDSTCLLHTWYISADIQFYCLAPVFLMALYRWPVLGYITLALATSSCSIITGLLTIFYYLAPTIIFFSPDIELTKKTANLIYFRPYPHMGAYCVGLALGYMLWKHKKIPINRIFQVCGWCLSLTSCLGVLLATYPWSQGQMPNPIAGVIYAIIHRTVWAAGVAWVLFMCATKRAGIINKFLSWNLFTPLSRLCYSVYLLHFPVLWVRVSWRRTLLNFHHYDIVTEFFGILMVTVFLSIFFHLVFEVPFLNLENIWFPRSVERKKSMEMKQKI